MLNFLKKLFGAPEAKTTEPAEVVPSAPYKVPEPAATTPIPLVVTNSNPADNVPVVEAAPTKKPAKPKAPAKAKAPIKAPAKPKAPRKPRMTVAK